MCESPHLMVGWCDFAAVAIASTQSRDGDSAFVNNENLQGVCVLLDPISALKMPFQLSLNLSFSQSDRTKAEKARYICINKLLPYVLRIAAKSPNSTSRKSLLENIGKWDQIGRLGLKSSRQAVRINALRYCFNAIHFKSKRGSGTPDRVFNSDILNEQDHKEMTSDTLHQEAMTIFAVVADLVHQKQLSATDMFVVITNLGDIIFQRPELRSKASDLLVKISSQFPTPARPAEFAKKSNAFYFCS